MSLIVVDTELSQKKHNKELGLYVDGKVQEFLFCPSKNCKPKKQTKWNTNRLHGTAWSSGEFEYDKLFDVSHDINTMNAALFVKCLELCKLASRLLGQCVENLDDYGFPNIQDLIVAEEGWNVSWICSSYLFYTNQDFSAPKGKQTCMENGICIS